MKVRSQRTHLMGKSNRQIFNSTQKTKSVHERSFNRSTILDKTTKIKDEIANQMTNSMANSMANQIKNQKSMHFQKTQNKSSNLRENPFNGTNCQLESRRFDKMNIKEYRYQKNQKTKQKSTIKDFSDRINQNIKGYTKQYEGKNINTQKIYLFKQSILKNNRDRINFQEYFNKFASKFPDQTAKITEDGFKSFVKSFGYDLNPQEISLFLRMNIEGSNPSQDNNNQAKDISMKTSMANTKSSNKDNSKPKDDSIQLSLKQFVKICTKDSIYFKTIDLTLNGLNKINHKTFIPRHFQILRNKFNKIKQAFKIYQNRNQLITYDRYVYTMKKLDINDLIMPKPERDQLFKQFSDQSGILNADRLLGEIAAHYNQDFEDRKVKTGFQNNLKFISEQNAQKQENKLAKFNLKRSSFIEYENHLKNARAILYKLRQLYGNSEQKSNIIRHLGQNSIINRVQLSTKLQDYLLKKGFSYNKQKYESLIGYLDFDVKNNISLSNIKKFIFQQSDKDAEARIQRQTRNLPPIIEKQITSPYFDPTQALKTLNILREQSLNPQISHFFTKLDKDKDGFISKHEFQSQIKNILHNVQPQKVQNVVNYFYENKNCLNRGEFRTKYAPQESVSQNIKTKSISQFRNMRNSCIQQFKTSYYQRPTKYSAWPDHLYDHNLSLIQAPKQSGIYADQTQRFDNCQKHRFGFEQKMQRKRRANIKVSKLSALNKQHSQQRKFKMQEQQRRQEQKNFKVRLVREQYNERLLSNE